MPSPAPPSRSGLLYALAAYTWWGLSALYFKALPGVPALVILCHRFVWSVLLLAVVIAALRRWAAVRAVVADFKQLRWLLLTAVLITCNWLVFIYAIETHRLVDASLGYFINPLFTVVLGTIFLRERLTRWQLAAVVLAFAGLLYLALARTAEDGVPWIAASLPMTFGFYSLIRKRLTVDPLTGLFIETAFLSPLALAFLAWAHTHPAATPVNAPGTLAILSLAGVVTTIPLLCFAAAARRLPMVTLGFLQFLNPTLQFLTAVALFREPFGGPKLVAFGFIWIAVAIFVTDLAWRSRRPS